MPQPPIDEDAGPDAPLLPDVDGAALLEFLTSALQDLEAAQGEEDDEARGLLAELGAHLGGGGGTRPPLREAPPGQQQQQRQQQARGGPAVLSDLEIASQIDR